MFLKTYLRRFSPVFSIAFATFNLFFFFRRYPKIEMIIPIREIEKGVKKTPNFLTSRLHPVHWDIIME
jgi:hypothetical protein